MKRIIVDYSKLTTEILTLLVDKFPDGYDDSDIIRFKNAKDEMIEAVEVRTEDTIYLVKVSTKLASKIENFDEDDLDDVAVPIDAIKDIDKDMDIDDDDDDDDVEDKIELDDEDDDKDLNDIIDEEDDDED
ncbi:DNA primase [Flavobacterium sp. NST-5]|uniref:DNA primase n=1 Tax=Flavobacterium ichthyis TaxID=2698827 RepID=A0ABW9ZEB0_9FLAO|nr:DNA primase [Flavobacterium ichthyis]NBL65113.1 DNA primase [Flavobacterium ichthyis]